MKTMTCLHRISRIVLLSVLLLLSSGHTGYGQQTESAELPNEIPLDDKVYILSQVWSEIKYNFVNLDHVGFDIDSLYRETLSETMKSDNDIDFYNSLERFMCSFNDGHTQVLRTNYNWNQYFDYIPYGIVEIGGKYYFSSVRKSTETDPSLLGAEIIEVEGLPVRDYIRENIFPRIAASTENFKWTLAANELGNGLQNGYFSGRAKKPDGQIIPFSIKRDGELTRTEDDEYLRLKQATPKPRKKYDLEWHNNTAVLTLNSFSNKVVTTEEIDSLFYLVLEKADGLILDLRTNGGGSTDMANHVIQYLTAEDFFLNFGSQTRINNGYGRAQGNYRDEYADFYMYRSYKTNLPDTIYVDRNLRRVECPVVVLIGKRTYSAAEDFLVNLYELPCRPIFIGEETGGSTGAPLVLNLPYNTVVRICTLRILYPHSMQPFVNQGVMPDIEVKQSYDDYVTDRDIVLETALKRISTQSSR